MGGKVALIDEYGAFLRVKDGRFRLEVKGKVLWEAAPVELDTIAFVTKGAAVSIAALELASRFGIDVVVILGNKPVARLMPATYGSTIITWRLQVRKSHDENFSTRIARLIVEAKLHNQRMVLREYSKRAKAAGRSNSMLEGSIRGIERLLPKLSACKSPREVMEVEARAARYYWPAVAALLPKQLGFETRLKRGEVPREGLDAFNRALNIGYGILKSLTWRAVFLAGLNPYIGFLHKFRSGRMSLVFDLMEPFRPISVDRPLISLARTDPERIIGLRSDSEGEKRGAAIEVWKALINYMAKVKPPHYSLMLEQARSLARELRGTGKFKPFRSKW